MYTKLTDREAIAKVMLIRDEIRNHDTEKYEEMSYQERLECTDALAQVINLATSAIENLAVSERKSSVELFKEVFAEKGVNPS